MIDKAIKKVAFIKVTKAVLQDTDTSMNDILDAISYIKEHKLDTDQKALAHYMELIKSTIYE